MAGDNPKIIPDDSMNEDAAYQILLGFQNSNWPGAGSDKEKKTIFESPFFLETVLHSQKCRGMLISILSTNQERYDSLSEEDLKKVSSQPFNLCGGTKLAPLITEKTFLCIELIVEFAKKIPGFSILCVEDQSLLLKMCHSEIMLLNTSRKYDLKNGSIFFANNGPFTRGSFQSEYASVKKFGDMLFQFCRAMWCMEVDNTEYALLKAIVTFSNSPLLRQAKLVEKFRAFYIHVLRAYKDFDRPGFNRSFNLIDMLPTLQILSSMYHRIYMSLEVDIQKLPPFLEHYARKKALQ